MERMANLTVQARGVRILALASIFGLVACGGGGTDTGEGGAGAAGKPGTGGAGGKGGSGGMVSTGGNGTGGVVGSGGGAGSGATTGTGGVTGTGGAAGLTGSGGSGGSGGSSGASGSAGTSGAAGMDAAVDSGPTDAGSDSRPDGGNGGPCSAATDCTSNFCVDGVCCESACTGLCNACASAKTGAADGLCRPVTAGSDPDNECTATAATSCGLDGMCDGAGACRKWIIGTTCGTSESCSGSTDTSAQTCDGTGTCRTATTASCGNYVCGPTSCKTTCLSNADCTTGNFCSPAGHCVPPQANGAACTAGPQCTSGDCVDGVCCASACGTLCSACSNVKTGMPDGVCAPVTAGTDPDSECAQDPFASCGHDGTCDGAGACRLYLAGTGCTNETCSGSTDTLSRKCDGAGTCLAATTASCAPYMCGATSCATTCSADTDCTTGYFCSAGVCTAQETNGTACGAAGACQSGFCVDGVCCDTACTGTCMTCDGVGTVGTCSAAVSGTDTRNDCTASATTTCGLDGSCDGSGACRKWGAGTPCGVAACANATVSPVPGCDGAGTCVAGAPSSCGVYQCSGTGATCKTSCTLDTDCNNGFCSAGLCVANNSVTPVNLAGNGNVEYGTTAGWSTNGGGTLVVETGAGLVNGGTYSIADTARTANYMGPAYALPTGAGKYNITAWAMQNTDPMFLSGVIQLGLNCASPSVQHFPPVGNFGVSLPSGMWTKISGTVDLTATPGCDPSTTGGVVDSVMAYLNQTGTETPTNLPNLFMDDFVLTVTDGHNLIGNPNFEAGTTAGWSQSGGSLAISTAQAHGGTNSMVDTGRTQTYQGPKWNLPIGTAKYNVSFYALHTGSLPHSLMLQPVYTCGTGAQQFPASVGVASNVAGGTWNQLAATVTFPPANAPAGCQLTAAGLYIQQEGGTCGTGTGQVECPDIYVDDASITLAP